MKRALVPAALSLFLSGLSGWVPRLAIDVVPGSEDCHFRCIAAGAGWPLAYVVDGHGLSPHGSADLFGVLLGVDRLDARQALLNWLVWLCIVVAVRAAWAGRRQRAGS